MVVVAVERRLRWMEGGIEGGMEREILMDGWMGRSGWGCDRCEGWNGTVSGMR